MCTQENTYVHTFLDLVEFLPECLGVPQEGTKDGNDGVVQVSAPDLWACHLLLTSEQKQGISSISTCTL